MTINFNLEKEREQLLGRIAELEAQLAMKLGNGRHWRRTMTATREHLAGLELAYEPSQMNSFPVSFERSLEQLIDQAQSAPAPVQGEAVEYQQLSRYGNWDRIDKAAFDIGKLGQAPERFRALYTAVAKPDAELVNILKSVVDYYAEGDGDLKCIAQACRAKLVELAGVKNE